MSEITQFDEGARAAGAIKHELMNGIKLHDPEYDLITAALFSGGHILWEGGPGTAKTVASKAIATAVGGTMGRVQGTPDVMPADITGSRIYNMAEQKFEFIAGPAFSTVLHLDELNRIPAKSQAGLLEVLEEGQITVDGETHTLPTTQLVVATQNPKSYEGGSGDVIGALRDRFTASIFTPEKTGKELLDIYRWKKIGKQVSRGVVDIDTIQEIREKVVQQMEVSSDMEMHAANILDAAVRNESVADSSIIQYRALESGLEIAKALAMVRKSMTVERADINAAFRGALPHRIDPTYGSKMTPLQIVDKVLEQVA